MSKPFDISTYATIVFDCDGVVLNSNKVKTEAFRRVALSDGEDAAQELVEYHVDRGGISRYAKFEYFLDVIVSGRSGPDLAALLKEFAAEVKKGF